MRFSNKLLPLVLVVVLMAMVGCTKTHVVTTDLALPLESPATFSMGVISDELPAEVEMEDKPSQEDIQKFKEYIVEEIGHRDDLVMEMVQSGGSFEIRGRLLDYSKGSGALRFFIGFGAGKASLTTQLDLVSMPDERVLFSGNFIGAVSSWAEAGDQMFKRVARDFSKVLEKQQKELLKD